MKYNKQAVTLVELIIVITIIVIISGIGFSSYVQYIGDSRDTQRQSDLSNISSALKTYKQNRGYYPTPGNNFNITFSGTTVAIQGLLNKNVRLNTLEKLPYDPKTEKSYIYSVTDNKLEFQVVGVLENDESEITVLNGTYKTVSKNNLPTILLATGATIGSNIEIQSGSTDGDVNRKLFIYHNQSHNLSYNFTYPYEPLNDSTSFDDLLTQMESSNDFWQNSDFRNCTEIQEGGKLLLTATGTTVEYQIISSTGALTNTGCTM